MMSAKVKFQSRPAGREEKSQVQLSAPADIRQAEGERRQPVEAVCKHSKQRHEDICSPHDGSSRPRIAEGSTGHSAATLGVVLGFLGVLLIARPWSTGEGRLDLWGVGAMILGSLSIGSSFVYARRFMAGLDITPLALSTYQLGFALCILAAVTPFSGMGNLGESAVALIGLVLGLGLAGTGVAYVLYYYIVQRMGAVQASAVTYLPPVVALLIGCLLVGEPLRMMDLIAMSAIVGGVYVIQTCGPGGAPEHDQA